MDGVHDLGGREGFGPVDADAAEPVFRHEWEQRAFGLTFATFVAGLSNGGQFRHSIERMHAVHYLTSRYYEHWLTGVATRAVETGVVEHAELERRAGGSFALSFPTAAEDLPSAPPDPATDRPQFVVGDRVRVRHVTTRRHTRCPAYVRGRAGDVVRVDPPASLPDVEAHSAERRLTTIYSVQFASTELWGPTAEPAFVHVDLWHDYLDAA